MISQAENSIEQNVEAQLQNKTQSDSRKNILFLVVIGGILAIVFILNFASLITDTLTISEHKKSSLKYANFGATSVAWIYHGIKTTQQYDEECKESGSDSVYCELYHRGGAWIAFGFFSLVFNLIACCVIVSLLINSSKAEALFKSKKNQYLVITISAFIMALLQIISVMVWTIDFPITHANIKIGQSVAMFIVTIVFNLGCFASLILMIMKNGFNL